MKPPGYENLAYRRPPGYETSDGIGYPAENRAAALAALDDVPIRNDASGTGTFRTPDGVLHQHNTGNPPVTSCNCGQHIAARGARRTGRTVRSSTRPNAATRAMWDEMPELQVLQMRTRLLELGA